MADNPLINSNSAAPGAVNISVAADDIGGVQYQRVKACYGADGSATDVSTANPMPVNDAAAMLSLASIDSKAPALVGGDVPVTLAGEAVTISGTVPVSGPLTDAQLRAAAVPVSTTSLPLPSGAATSAAQTTGNASLSSIDGKAPALVGGRVPVDGSGVTQPVSGPLTDTQLRATAVPVSIGSMSLPTGASTSALQTTGNTSLSSIDTKTPALVTGRVPVDGSGVTQPVSGTVAVSGTVPVSAAALPLPTGASTSALQTTGNASLSSIDGKLPTLISGDVPVTLAGEAVTISGTVPVSGPLTDAQLRATAVPVSIGAMALPTGAATEATLAALEGKIPVLGQAVAASSLPVVMASDAGLTLGTHDAGYTPGYDGPSPAASVLNTDPSGQLLIRGPVHTDESSSRVNFANTSLAVSVGSPTRSGLVFSGGSLGSGTLDLHVGDYLKYDADPESAWAEVEALDGTTATVAAYTGSATSGAASRALVKPNTQTGGTISVGSGALTIASGVTSGTQVGVTRSIDYAPLVWSTALSVSQRVANQELWAGLWEATATPRWFARFRFTGASNTTVICETGRNPTGAPSASETQSTTANLLPTATSAASNEYRVELLTERVVFYVNGEQVAEHRKVIPAQHDEMTGGVWWVNTGIPTTSNAVVDYIAAKNHNKLEIGVMSDREKIVAALQPMRELSYSLSGVIAINTDLLVIDCRQFASVQIQCALMGTSGVVTPQWANESTFSNLVGATITTSAGADATTFNAAGLWQTPVQARYLRLRLTTATTGGITQIYINGSAFPAITRLATQPVSGTVTATVTSTRIAPNAADGHSTTHHLISAATTNATSVKASAGAIGMISVTNANAAARYFKLYNKASAPTVGTDTPVMTVLLKPGETTFIVSNSPIRLSTGIAYALTTGQPVADTGAVAVSEHAVGIFYT